MRVISILGLIIHQNQFSKKNLILRVFSYNYIILNSWLILDYCNIDVEYNYVLLKQYSIRDEELVGCNCLGIIYQGKGSRNSYQHPCAYTLGHWKICIQQEVLPNNNMVLTVTSCRFWRLTVTTKL